MLSWNAEPAGHDMFGNELLEKVLFSVATVMRFTAGSTPGDYGTPANWEHPVEPMSSFGGSSFGHREQECVIRFWQRRKV